MISNPLKHLNRHRQMIGLLYKYGTTDLIQKSGLAEQFSSETNAAEVDGQDASHDWTQTLAAKSALEQKLPARANKFAELIANNEIKAKVEAFDEPRFISGLDKVANRISSGLIISAMIVAAALMMRVDVGWKVGGYPAIALAFLTMAGVAGSILVWRVIVSDQIEE